MSRLHGRVAMAVYVLWGAVGSVLSAWLTRVIYGNKPMISEDQCSQKQNTRRELTSSPSTTPSQWAESQLLHVACAYSNPFRCRSRRDLMDNFMPHMRTSPNAVLHVGELAYGDRPFEVTGSDPGDVQLRTEHELWHKENILNAVISRFPADWKYGAYVDGDFVMTRYDWALEAIQQLQHHDFVQLFSGYSDMTADHRPFRIQPSFSYAQWNYTPAAVGSALRPSRARNTTPGATGGAWAFRRDALHKVGGLLDSCILGAADWYMAFGFIGKTTDGHPEAVSCGAPYEASIRRWQDRAYAAVKGNIGYVENHAIHHWHGSKANRGYGSRWQILRDNDFDPQTDIFRDGQGIWQLASNKPKLRDDIRRYFLSRSEDSSTLSPSEVPLI